MAALNNNLWTLYTVPNQPLPILTRNKASVNNNAATQGSSNIANAVLPTKYYTDTSSGATADWIDVVNTFPWTVSPQTSRVGVPYATLIERRIIVNSNVSNIINSILATTQSANSVLPTSLQNSITKLLQTGGQAGNALLKNASQSLYNIVNNAQGAATNTGGQNSGSFNNPALAPYDYLYITENTGFNYKFPYLGDSYNDSSLDFGSEAGGILGQVAGAVEGFAGLTTNLVGALKPGVYIEKSKQFAMGDNGRKIELVFPLLNTRKVSDISRNWQLLYGLIYQNRPGRITRSIIDLPVIYQVQIPGVVYMPYAFISGLSVKFLGRRRLQSVTVPISNSTGANFTTIETIVPDAYEVSISLQGLNEETRNFLYASVNPNPVTVGKSPINTGAV